jgi:hypothetical protein
VPGEYRHGFAFSAVAVGELVREVAGELRGRLPGPDVTPQQLQRRDWWTGPEVFVLVDDYDLLAGPGGGPLDPLLDLLPQAADIGHPQLRRLLDMSRPAAVLLLGVLHFIPDEDDPAGIVARLRDALAAGSYAALVSVTHEDQPPEVIEAQKLSARTGTPIYLRSRDDLREQLKGFTLVEPGLVHLPLWRPDSPLDVDEHPERFGALAGVGRKDA